VAKGEAANPLSAEEVERKFRLLTGGQADQILQIVRALETLDAVPSLP
jgi:hypothetical protein